MAFPAKEYFRLWSLQRRWGVSQEDIFHAVQNDMLRICIWLPLRYVERCIVKDRKFIYEAEEAKEGFVGIRPKDCHKICSKGDAKLRIFNSLTDTNRILRLPYEPPQPSIHVSTGDLVVLKEDLAQFEHTYHIKPSEADIANTHAPTGFTASKDYKHVEAGGVGFNLGDVQASIIEQLHDASRSENPWLHSKTLIHNSQSKATRMRDIFTRKEHWEHLLLSDGRGYYRLNTGESEEFQQYPAYRTVERKYATD